jgi:peptide/nickel transport system substrate-binding protein
MKNSKLLAIIAICMIATGIFAAVPAFAVQPPIDTTTEYVGTIGQPQRLDPARAYDTASGELIQNIYQTLIWYDDKHPITFTQGVGYNLTLADYADLTKFKPVLATAMPTITSDGTGGSYWSFNINTNAVYQPWMMPDGVTVVPKRNITRDDVVYSFRRSLVVEMSSAPTWMYFMPGFGNMGFRYQSDLQAYSNGTFKNPQNESYVGNKISNWCYPGVGPNEVVFHWQYAWAPNVLYQILSQTWGSVVNPDFCKMHGGWDGLFTTGASASDMTAGWSNLYRRKPDIRASELDAYKPQSIYGPVAGSKYTTGSHDVPCASGTGPYNFTSGNWDQAAKTWRIDRFEDYWLGWAGNHLRTVIVKGVDSWPTRKMLFLEGEFDVVAVPRANMFDLLAGGTDPYNPIQGVNLVYNVATLQNDVLLFTANVSETSAYQSYVGYPVHKTSAVATFFADAFIRQAFAWAFDYTNYIHDAWFDEAILQRSWWVDGLSPADYKNMNASMPQRQYSLTQMKNALNKAALISGFNVSTDGFDVTLVYNSGNDQRLIACQLMAQAFQTLGSQYKVNVVAADWPVFLSARDNGELAAYDVGWLADFADPDNFARPYQHSAGDFTYSQGPPWPADQDLVDAEIDQAVVEADNNVRKFLYEDLQYRYWLDALSFPLVQPVGRRFSRDWLQGWYQNSLLPGGYFYDYYKQVVLTQNVDVDMTATVTPATPIYNPVYIFHGEMRIGGGSPAPAKMNYSLHVKRNDASSITTLYASVGLTRTLGSDKQFAEGGYVSLLAGGSATLSITWYENGVDQVMVGNATGIPYAVAGETAVINRDAFDNVPGNNKQSAGTLIAKTLTGDVNGDGLVDIFDAISLANAFNAVSGDSRYKADADLNGDGIIDIFDAISLALNYGKSVP